MPATQPAAPYLRSPRPPQREKPLWVYLPGMDGTGQLLRNQIPSLAPHFDIRCLVIPAQNRMGWEALAAAVIGLIQAQRPSSSPPQEIYLCGESFGGCLALQMAVHSPPLFKGLVLVNPALSFYRRSWMAWGGQLAQWFPEPLYDLSALGLLPFLVALERLTEADRYFFLNNLRQVPQATSAWRLSMLSLFNPMLLPTERLTQPILMVVSGADRLLPSVTDAQEFSQRLLQGQGSLHILPHSGHACLLEQGVNLRPILQAHPFLKHYQPVYGRAAPDVQNKTV